MKTTKNISLPLAAICGLFLLPLIALAAEPPAREPIKPMDLSPGAQRNPAAAARTAEAGRAEADGDMFPGVRGMSGEELQRKLAEYDRRREMLERQRQPAPRPVPQKPADPAPAPKPLDLPAATAEEKPKPEEAERPAERRPARTRPDRTPPTPAALDLEKLTAEQRDYLAALEQQVELIEKVLEKSHLIRKEAETEAVKIDYEPRIQYYLRYQRTSAPQTRAYAQTLAAPLPFYRFVVDQATQVAASAAPENMPAGMPDDAARHVEKLNARSAEARRQALLAAAELYTRIRHLVAAELIYRRLLTQYPEDAAIVRSHATYVAVRDEPKPTAPPMRESQRLKDALEKREEEKDSG